MAENETIRVEMPGMLIAAEMVCVFHPNTDLWEITIDFGAEIVKTAKHTYQRGAIMKCILDYLGFESHIVLRPENRESE